MCLARTLCKKKKKSKARSKAKPLQRKKNVKERQSERDFTVIVKNQPKRSNTASPQILYLRSTI